MRKLFRREKPAIDDIVTERWETRFFWKNRARFVEDDTPDYEGRIQGRELTLTLKRRNLFAWVADPVYRYRDFYLQAEMSFPADAGYSAAGLLFRYVNEANYYYFLVSTRGFFRFDVVFNGTPMRLIDWTELPAPIAGERTTHGSQGAAEAPGGAEATGGVLTDPFSIFVVANGTRFTLGYNDSWIAELDDDTVDAGSIAFGAQNYDEQDRSVASLRRLLLDSHGLEVETLHYRYRDAIPVDPEARLRLARTLFAADNPTTAIIQLRKAARRKKPDAETLFLLAECQLNLGLHENALENVERSLALDPDKREAQHEKANLLYLLGRYVELRDYLGERVEDSDSSTLWNLYGHATYSLGAWEEAARAYTKAAGLEPEMPLFDVNAARAFEHLGNRKQALDYYLRAARLFVGQDALEDLAAIIPAITSIDAANRDVRAFQGIVAFQEGDLAAAGRLFDELVEEGYEEGSIFYMLGIVRNQEGDRRAALGLFRRATELDPGFALYWFRLAETEYLLGEDSHEALAHALELAPGDHWTLNLAGQIYLDAGRIADAVAAFEKACAAAPEEVDITVNYAEALFRAGEVRRAIALLEGREEAQALNTLGNLYSRLGRSVEALAAYEQSYAADPDDPTIIENLAAACIEADLVNRAEELLGKLMERAPSPSVMNRVGNLARIEGDLVRAETAYRGALDALGLPDLGQPLSGEMHERLAQNAELNRVTAEVEANLADLYLQWSRYELARLVVERLIDHAPSERARAIEQRLRSASELRLSCASCGREWWAPRTVEAPAVVRLHGEPPAEAPAGRCERCGKVYCVGCAVEHLQGNRFVCAGCGGFLKLNDDHLKYLVLKYVEAAREGRS